MKYLRIIPILAIIYGLFLFLARFNINAAWNIVEFIHKIMPTDAIIIYGDKAIGWGLSLWFLPISLVLVGIIGWIILGKRYNKKYNKNYRRKRYGSNLSAYFSRFFDFVRSHKLLVFFLLAIIFIFTIRLEAWAWLAIGVFAIAILPPLIMFVFYNLIAKAIWKR